jgi:hypothetical protein
VVAHLSRALSLEGYRGTPVHALYRDEVQDFMQGELLLDLRVAADPNALFYCGDTAQTIARGVGFRFTDVKTLFFEEGNAALVAQRATLAAVAAAAAAAPGEGPAAAAAPLPPRPEGATGQPLEQPLIEHLRVNYRTHSGILDAAAAVVDLLRRFFPRHIDSLQRETAFFRGPKVLLVCGAGAGDVARLLSWSDRSASQVEFGAHQVVLVRGEESKARLPGVLRGARPLTVPQAKGLEFDDVLLYDFFSGGWCSVHCRVVGVAGRPRSFGCCFLRLPAAWRVPSQLARLSYNSCFECAADSLAKDEWRVLLSYLEELEAAQAGGAGAGAAAARPLLPAHEACAGVGELGKDSLRPLPFDPARCNLLCDELKHLYTALTRAKNFAAIVDRDAAARAPFYHFLARLGLGRVVTDVAEIDKSDLGMSKHKSTPAEWAQRGHSLLELGLFEAAEGDFRTAGDAAMAQYCAAREGMRRAQEAAAAAPAEARSLYLGAGLQLLDLAVNGRPNAELAAALKRVRRGGALRCVFVFGRASAS